MRLVGIPTSQATDAETTAAVAAVVASAPAALDTLLELAAAINNDATYYTTVANALALKLAAANNLSDVGSAATARSNLAVLGTAGGTMSGAITMADQVMTAPELKDVAETLNAHGNLGASVTIDCTTGNVHSGTANANCTFTFSNPPVTGKLGALTLILTADGTVRTHTWPGSVKWVAGTAPTMTGTLNKVDILTFITPDGGTTWYGFVGGQNF